MPKLPDKGMWRLQAYSGMGGVRWQPPFDYIELHTTSGATPGYCLMRTPGATCRCDIAVPQPGKFTADYDLKGKHGEYEAALGNDGSLRIEFAGQSFTGVGCNQSGHVAVVARPFIENPSLALKGGFCPAVLRHPEFQKSGILWGADPELARSCQWVVIDPARFKMMVWEMAYPTQDVVSGAQSLGAAVFTNGPYFIYTPGQQDSLPEHILRGYYKENRAIAGDLSVLMRAVGVSKEGASDVANIGSVGATVINISRDGLTWTARIAKKLWGPSDDATRMLDMADRAAPTRIETPTSMKAWQGGGPCGYVLGNNGLIQIKRPASHLAYFGRGQGTDFGSYSIGMGDPVGYTEAIGALQLAAKDYKATDVELASGSNQWLYWALIPLSDAGSRLPTQAGMKEALSDYAAAGSKAPDGLIIGVYYNTNSRIQLLIDVGARDVVRLDGSDSVIFGRGSEVLVGDTMTPSKKIAQGWGFAFYPK
jgi:hypothetical protein